MAFSDFSDKTAESSQNITNYWSVMKFFSGSKFFFQIKICFAKFYPEYLLPCIDKSISLKDDFTTGYDPSYDSSKRVQCIKVFKVFHFIIKI